MSFGKISVGHFVGALWAIKFHITFNLSGSYDFGSVRFDLYDYVCFILN